MRIYLTRRRNTEEVFNDFYTNRKNAVSNLVNARSDTEQTAQEVDNSVSSAAKIRRNPETAKFSDKILTNHAQIATQRVLYYNKPGFF